MDRSPIFPSRELSPLHRGLLLGCFSVAVLFLLNPLYLPRKSKADDDRGPSISSFAETAQINQIARVAIGAEELAERYPAAGSLTTSIHDAVREGERTEKGRTSLVLRLALYDALDMDPAFLEIKERLAKRETATQAPGDSRGDSDPASLIEKLYLGERTLSLSEIERVERAFGFTGKLAHLHNLSLTDSPEAQAFEEGLRSSAVRYLIGFVVVIGLILFLLGTGFLLLVVAWIRMRMGQAPSRFEKPALPGWLHLEAFTAFLFLMTAASLVTELVPRPKSLPLLPSLILQCILLVIVLYPRLYRAPWGELRSDLGLSMFGRAAWKEVLLGPVGYVASLPLIALGVSLTLLIVRFTDQNVSEGMHPIVPMIKGENASMINAAMALLVAVVLAPILEEITFRGFLYNALRSRFSSPVAIGLSAAFFAGIHPQGIIGFPMLMAIGVMLAGLREWRGSLTASIIAHGCTNGVTLLIVILGY